ncbi:MAG: hypothetical protein M1837_005094 [Sclerophora amabilis]|nr:MAG: hypothetical protein M1837_005094 [Sclerophora amabilis]
MAQSAPPQASHNSPPMLHTNFNQVTIHTAKCDLCNRRNYATLQRCTLCGWSCCAPCWLERGGDGTHVINAGDAGWTAQRATAIPEGGCDNAESGKRKRKTRAKKKANEKEMNNGNAEGDDTREANGREKKNANTVEKDDGDDGPVEASNSITATGTRRRSKRQAKMKRGLQRVDPDAEKMDQEPTMSGALVNSVGRDSSSATPSTIILAAPPSPNSKPSEPERLSAHSSGSSMDVLVRAAEMIGNYDGSADEVNPGKISTVGEKTDQRMSSALADGRQNKLALLDRQLADLGREIDAARQRISDAAALAKPPNQFPPNKWTLREKEIGLRLLKRDRQKFQREIVKLNNARQGIPTYVQREILQDHDRRQSRRDRRRHARRHIRRCHRAYPPKRPAGPPESTSPLQRYFSVSEHESDSHDSDGKSTPEPQPAPPATAKGVTAEKRNAMDPSRDIPDCDLTPPPGIYWAPRLVKSPGGHATHMDSGPLYPFLKRPPPEVITGRSQWESFGDPKSQREPRTEQNAGYRPGAKHMAPSVRPPFRDIERGLKSGSQTLGKNISPLRREDASERLEVPADRDLLGRVKGSDQPSRARVGGTERSATEAMTLPKESESRLTTSPATKWHRRDDGIDRAREGALKRMAERASFRMLQEKKTIERKERKERKRTEGKSGE